MKTIEMYLICTKDCTGENICNWSLNKEDGDNVVDTASFEMPEGFEMLVAIDGKNHIYGYRDLEDDEHVDGWRCCQIITHKGAPRIVAGNKSYALKRV